MAEPRRPQAPARPTPPARRTAAQGSKARTSAAKPRSSAKPQSDAPGRGLSDAAAKVTDRARRAGRSVTRAASSARDASRSPAREDVRQAAPRASSTLAAHRPDASGTSVPTPWAKVAAHSATNVTNRMQERLRERRTAHTRLLAVRWGKRAAVLLGAVAVVWLVLMSPVFAFDPAKVEATGFGSVVDEADVESVIAAHEGTSLALLDTSGIESAIEDLVGVRDVSVERVWPAGLLVTIESSEPVAAIPRVNGGFVLVDDRGDAVDSAKQPPESLPVVTIPLEEGETRILTGVLAVIDELPVSLRERVEGVEAETEDSIHFVLRDGPTVEWGSGEDSALKAEVLQVLLDSEDAANADVIDVSAPSLPITKSE